MTASARAQKTSAGYTTTDKDRLEPQGVAMRPSANSGARASGAEQALEIPLGGKTQAEVEGPDSVAGPKNGKASRGCSSTGGAGQGRSGTAGPSAATAAASSASLFDRLEGEDVRFFCTDDGELVVPAKVREEDRNARAAARAKATGRASNNMTGARTSGWSNVTAILSWAAKGRKESSTHAVGTGHLVDKSAFLQVAAAATAAATAEQRNPPCGDYGGNGANHGANHGANSKGGRKRSRLKSGGKGGRKRL